METAGFIQLTAPDGRVLAQRTGSASFAQYCRRSVWYEKDGNRVVFSDTSDVAHPEMFFSPVARDAMVHVYCLSDAQADGCVQREPEHTPPLLMITSAALEKTFMEEVEPSLSDTLALGWVAYINGQWVGTSEY